MTSQASWRNQFARALVHPVSLVSASVISVILWMPFGLGYYDFSWDQPLAVLLLLTFVVAFPTSAAAAVARSCRPRFLPLRFFVAVLSLPVGLYGLFHMLVWWIRISWKF